MSAHKALRSAVRPLKRTKLFDQIAIAAGQRPLWQHPRSQICLRCCGIAVGPNSNPIHIRFFSTAPPPPRKPPPSIESLLNSNPEPESATAKDGSPAASTPSSSSKPSDQPLKADTKQSVPSSSSSSGETAPEREKKASESESKEEAPGDSASPQPETDTQAQGSSSSSSSSSSFSSSSSSSLPSFAETHRHPLSARFSTFMDNLQSRVLTATQTINDLTGYSAIEAIKRRNSELEREHAAAQQRLRAARHNYKSLTAHRAATQREVTTLLARKDTWTPVDLERFTTLYRSDHELEAQVGAAAAELTEAEADEARLAGELNAGILKRYHEEQIWSDRIRRQSTWGTWGLMGVNVVLFLVLQFVAEPWRRRRLVNGIAEREKGFMDEVRRELVELKAASETAAAAATAAAASAAASAATASSSSAPLPYSAESSAVPGEDSDAAAAARDKPDTAWRRFNNTTGKSWKEVLSDCWEDPDLIREAVLDLISDRRIDLRMRDASLIALQGAAAGATLVAVLAVSVLRRT